MIPNRIETVRLALTDRHNDPQARADAVNALAMISWELEKSVEEKALLTRSLKVLSDTLEAIEI